MKKYSETFHDKFKNFIKLNTTRKLKWALRLLGIKHIIYNILYKLKMKESKINVFS